MERRREDRWKRKYGAMKGGENTGINICLIDITGKRCETRNDRERKGCVQENGGGGGGGGG